MTANHFENIADIVKQGLVSDSFKRLDHQLRFSAGTEEMIKNIYKEAYLAGQQTLDAIATDDIEKAIGVIDSKGRFGGLIERARSHLYSRLTQESPEHLSVYKIESNTIENYRRIHHLLVSVCELLINGSGAQSDDDVDQDSNLDIGQNSLSDGGSV